MMRWAVASTIAFAWLGASAQAQPHQATHYSYYGISGNSPGSIYTTMISRGPKVGGVKAYAKTLAISTPVIKMVQGNTCQIRQFDINFTFDINLPKLKNEAALTGRTKSEWKAFSGFLKVHEETHRRIWMEFANIFEARARGLKARTCSEMAAKIVKVRTQLAVVCNRRQEAFDNAQQQVLLRQPFVKLVLAQGTHSSTALKSRRKG